MTFWIIIGWLVLVFASLGYQKAFAILTSNDTIYDWRPDDERVEFGEINNLQHH